MWKLGFDDSHVLKKNVCHYNIEKVLLRKCKQFNLQKQNLSPFPHKFFQNPEAYTQNKLCINLLKIKANKSQHLRSPAQKKLQ